MSDDLNPPLEAITEELEEDIIENEPPDEGSSRNASASPRTRSTKRKRKAGRKRELLAAQKLDCLKHLRQSIDTLIYTELFILYYMDCSFFRLILRALAQTILFSPFSRSPAGRPYISGIFIPNIICLLLHIFTSRPEAGETMRGYLHGGIILDLIGQKETQWKFQFIILDVLVFTLQCFIVSVSTECRVLESYIKNKEYRNPTPLVTPAARSQDHDAEERGVFRVAGTTNLPDLARTSPPADGNLGEEEEQHSLLGDHLLRDPRSREDELQEWLNLHYSGIAVTAEFHIIQTLRKQYGIDKTRAERVSTAIAAGRLSGMPDIIARALEAEARNDA